MVPLEGSLGRTKEQKTKSIQSRITPRDILILSYAATHPFITAGDVRNHFWTNPKTRHHYERLGALVSMGYLHLIRGDNFAKLGYRITKRGIGLLPDDELKRKAFGMKNSNYRTGFDHNKLLNRVQDIFQKSNLVSNYRTEPEVRSLLVHRHGKKEGKQERFKVPDGLFTLTTPKTKLVVALELEMSVKSEVRYHKIFRALLTSIDFQSVFYITKNDSIKNILERILNEVRATDLVVKNSLSNNSIYFTTLEKLLDQGLDTTFEGENTVFTLNSLAKAAG